MRPAPPDPAENPSRVSHPNLNVLRLRDGQLYWYAPGSGDAPEPVQSPGIETRLRSALAEPRSALVFAVPGESLRLQSLDVTPEERRHLPQSLPYMLEEQVAADVEALHVAQHRLPGERILAMLCDREYMQHWSALLAAYNPRYWVPEALLLPRREQEWCLLLENGRALLQYAPGEGVALERELLPALLEALLLEQPLPDALVVYGEDEAAELDLLPPPLRALAQWRRGGFGSALLLQETPPAALPNLRQGPWAPRLPLQRWWQQWRAVASVAGAALLLQLVWLWADYRSLSQQNLALRAAIEAAYREAAPRGAVVDPERQLRQQLAALGAGQSGAADFVPLLAEVGTALEARPGTRLNSLNYSQRGGDLRLGVVAADFAAVEAVRATLERGGLRATLENSSSSGNTVRARLRVERGG